MRLRHQNLGAPRKVEKPFPEKRRWKSKHGPRMGSGNEAKTQEILNKWKTTRRRLRRRPKSAALRAAPLGFLFGSGWLALVRPGAARFVSASGCLGSVRGLSFDSASDPGCRASFLCSCPFLGSQLLGSGARSRCHHNYFNAAVLPIQFFVIVCMRLNWWSDVPWPPVR